VSDRAPEPGQVAGGADQRASRVGPGHVLGGRVGPCGLVGDQVAGGVWVGAGGAGGPRAGGGGGVGGGGVGGGGGTSRAWGRVTWSSQESWVTFSMIIPRRM